MKCFDNVEWKKKHGVIPVLSEDKKLLLMAYIHKQL